MCKDGLVPPILDHQYRCHLVGRGVGNEHVVHAHPRDAEIHIFLGSVDSPVGAVGCLTLHTPSAPCPVRQVVDIVLSPLLCCRRVGSCSLSRSLVPLYRRWWHLVCCSLFFLRPCAVLLTAATFDSDLPLHRRQCQPRLPLTFASCGRPYRTYASTCHSPCLAKPPSLPFP